jgi:hypothetical protein
MGGTEGRRQSHGVWVAAVGFGRRGRGGSVGGVGSVQRGWEEVEADEAARRGGEEETICHTRI